MFSSGFGGFGGASQGGSFGFGGFGNQSSTQPTFGFGAATTTTASSSGFGFGASGSGGMFGQNSGFGGLGSSSTASKMLPQLPVQGTAQPPYATTSERDSQYGAINLFHTISAMPSYKNFAFEELRLRDYDLGRKPSTNNSTAFGTAQQSGFGLPASQPAAPSFGTPTPSFNSFGSGFGQSTKSTTGFGFGAGTGTSTSLFNTPSSVTPAPTPFAAAATPTPAFGNTTTPFGQTQKPFGFGTGNAFGTTPSSGGFGTNLFGNTSTSSVSLFNRSTTSAPSFNAFNQNSQSTSGFGFGNTQTTSTPSLSFGTFNKPATTSAFGLGSSVGGFGSFSTTSTKPTFPSLSTPATGFSLGSTPTSLTQPSSTNLFGGVGLGNQSSTTGSAFTPSFQFNKPSATGSFLNPAQPFSTGGLFTNTAPTTFTVPTGIVATADMYPYSNMSLLQQGAVPSREPQRTDKPTATPIGVKKPPVTPHYKLEPRQSQKLKLKGYSPGLRRKKEPEQETPKPLEIFSDYSELISPEAFNRSRRRMINTRPVSLGSIINKDSIAPTPSKPPQQESTTLTFGTPKQENSRQSIFAEPQTPLTALGQKSSFTLSPLRRSPETPKPLRSLSIPLLGQEEVSTPPAQQERSVTPVQQILAEPVETITRREPVTESDGYGDYWTSPSLSELRNMSEAQLKKVVDFTIGRDDLGQIHFTESVDLTGISLSSLIGDVVEIVPRSASVYENSKTPKPPVGQGLNVPAAITLKKCWPIDKDKQTPIKNPADPSVRQRITRLKQMPGTEFISYDAYTGAWTFIVQHFTKYGLDESDDSDEQSIIYNRLTPQAEDSFMQGIPTSSELLEASPEIETVAFNKPLSLPEFRRQDPLEINEMQEAIFPPEGDDDYDTMEDILEPPAALPAGYSRLESFSSDEDRDTSAEVSGWWVTKIFWKR